MSAPCRCDVGCKDCGCPCHRLNVAPPWAQDNLPSAGNDKNLPYFEIKAYTSGHAVYELVNPIKVTV